MQRQARLNLVGDQTIRDNVVRSIPLEEKDLGKICKAKQPGEALAQIVLDRTYGDNNWKRAKGWKHVSGYFINLFSDMQSFPLDNAHYQFTYDNSWASARTYGGNRTHEGTDIMPPEQKRDLYKVYSVSDGTVTNIGWLPQGGWRVGITGTHGTYFYYAHLSSYADIKEGDKVKAGTFIGYMGDTGYSSTPGTTGNFPVHLHLGIYFIVDGEEVSINPYWILRYAIKNCADCFF